METTTDASSRPVRVLLVEDNIGDACLILKYLKDAKVPNQVVVARDGMEALDYLMGRASSAGRRGGSRPDLILLDLNLPRLCGRELLRVVKGDGDLRHIPVVVLTGSGSPDDALRCYEDSANCYLVKPFDLEHFVEAMKYVETVWLKPLGRA